MRRRSFHAYSRVYARDSPSSRTKDLVDLVLLIEAGLLGAGRLSPRLVRVWHERDGTRPPPRLPDPPPGWAGDYHRLSGESGVTAVSTSDAFALAAELYARARNLLPLKPDDQETR